MEMRLSDKALAQYVIDSGTKFQKHTHRETHKEKQGKKWEQEGKYIRMNPEPC